ncbi:MAG: T9SS type B sorting domain-containing protein [Cryomorphaceae bacterium]|nr:T9SS type B sorting domain-containing protein [Cryomorphaceae bacterium]
MRIFLIIISIFVLNSYAVSQIVNGGFEANSGMPSTLGEWTLVNGWDNAQSATASPDYFHINGSLGGDLPETPIAVVVPFEGNAVMGFIAAGAEGTNKREYLVNRLDAPLTVGMKYMVSFYITNGVITNNSQGGLATSHIGVCFSTGASSQTDMTPLIVEPEFYKSTPVYSREWIEMRFNFTATEPFEYMTIGVFRNDADISVVYKEGNSPQVAYYFVDDFQMEEQLQGITDGNDNVKGDDEAVDEPMTVAPGLFVPNAFTPNGDGENDIFVPVLPEVSKFKMSIFSRWGDLVYTTTVRDAGWCGHSISGELLDVDVYVWEIQYELAEDPDDKGTQTLRGTVNLIR